MIIKEYPYVDISGKEYPNLIRHYSDKKKTIKQVETGVEYTDAIDIYPCKYNYIESENDIIEEVLEGEKSV